MLVCAPATVQDTAGNGVSSQREGAAPSAAGRLGSRAAFYSQPPKYLQRGSSTGIASTAMSLCESKHCSVCVVCQIVWSRPGTAVRKGDARQHLLAADNGRKNRPWLCAQKLSTAAVPSKCLAGPV